VPLTVCEKQKGSGLSPDSLLTRALKGRLTPEERLRFNVDHVFRANENVIALETRKDRIGRIL